MDDIVSNHARVKVVYYTHPLCTISWAMLDSWKRLRNNHKGLITFQLCISELTPEIKDRLGQAQTQLKGAHCVQMCQAVKAASLQSEMAADLYLSALRTAFFAEHRDLCSTDVLIDIGRHVGRTHSQQFNFNRFVKQIVSGESRKALIQDIRKIAINSIVQMPTMTFTVAGKGKKLHGYISYQQMIQALNQLTLAASPPDML